MSALRSGPSARNAALVCALVAAALLLGMGTSLFGGRLVLLALAALVPLPLIFRDYRVGAVLLTLLLPISAMLPPIRGLNVLNFVTGATLASFALREAFAAPDQRVVALPRALVWCFWLPATWGILLAWPHIPEGLRNYPALDNAREVFAPWAYVTGRYLKPVFYYLAYAFLLANAVRDSRRPERFTIALAASAVLPALAVLVTVARYPGSLVDVSLDREFMAPRGMHANEFGMLLALAAGPLLFMAGGARSALWRRSMLATFALVTLALLLTFSRGALLAYLIVVAGYLLHHKRIKTILMSALLATLVLIAAPDSMKERFGTGLREGALSDTSQVEHDDLTAGRMHGWALLAPEVLDSPWLGRGLGSTQWSHAVAMGAYQANHPHNIYLEILMDLGVLGLAAMAWLHALYLRRYRQLAQDTQLAPELRAFFLGARYSLLGMLAMAFTTAYFMPNAAQAFHWFALGLAFAYWPQPSARHASRQVFQRVAPKGLSPSEFGPPRPLA
ncbi:MAG: O-antigen ligase family protein [Leptothrix sp. (in: b-proteobacteria)]